METTKIHAIQAYCDELTRDGQELSVTWEGGNDSGWLTLKLDGIEKENLTEIEHDLLHFVGEELGYGSFAGDFSTDGEAVYNRDTKCFIGEDTYSESEQGLQECAIELSLPEQVWFDTLMIQVEVQDGYDVPEANLTLQILNGPYPEHFDKIKSKIENYLQEMFALATNHIEAFGGLWETFLISRQDFQTHDGSLKGYINQFNYSYNTTDVKDIYIPFSE
ncbi:hypothetical protein [Pedobacter nutrimenti]|uniref:hypothetical protein n=1 Tax=Pedobacter nutrimenti TaxID=1241337 RepID=UPI00292D9386|nr:hypothetical protein [Pedobacter nutrimenti]